MKKPRAPLTEVLADTGAAGKSKFFTLPTPFAAAGCIPAAVFFVYMNILFRNCQYKEPLGFLVIGFANNLNGNKI